MRPREGPRELRIAIVGAGRLGTTLGRALRAEGHRIDAVVTNHAASARRAAKIIRPTTALTLKQLNSSTKAAQPLFASDLLIISTPDDAVESVAQRLAIQFRSVRQETKRRLQVALHTSGALPSEVLAPLREAGFAIGSMHPLVSVSEAAAPPDIFQSAYFCVEGDPRALRLARAIVKQLGGQAFSIPSEAKPLYHAAAAMASGHVVALFHIACGMLERCGISRRRAQEILLPLLESTAANLSGQSPAQALTGPLARGDFATAKKHLQAMEQNGLTDAAKIYALLGQQALELARTRGVSPRQLDPIAKLLASRTSRS